MRTKDWLQVGFFWLIVLLIFHPLFYTSYAYTDELVQLWHYRPGNNFGMFWGQGRWITEALFGWLFRSIDSVAQIRYIRLFSLCGWMVSIPIWFFITKQVVQKEGLSKLLPFLVGVYLICMPSFAVYVQWASCLELFLANTLGLLSGYTAYLALFKKEHTGWGLAMLSVLLGVLSLATYQTGFGYFLLPFVLRVTAQKNTDRRWWAGVFVYLTVYAVYFILFKIAVHLGWMIADQRTGIAIEPFNKLKFLFTRPLNGAFHFTWLFPEHSKPHFLLYIILFSLFLIATWWQVRIQKVAQIFKYFVTMLLLFALVYLPGLIVKENYASNRTLMALNITVFVLVIHLLFQHVHQVRRQQNMVLVLTVLFCLNAMHNFRNLFLNPIVKEYTVLHTAIKSGLMVSTREVHFIQPPEEFFVEQLGIIRSWDEFGVPSTFFPWVPEPFVKQIMYEKWGDRKKADALVVKNLTSESVRQQEPGSTDSSVVINTPLLLQQNFSQGQ